VVPARAATATRSRIHGGWGAPTTLGRGELQLRMRGPCRRPKIEPAKGILMARHAINEDAAFEMLRSTHSTELRLQQRDGLPLGPRSDRTAVAVCHSERLRGDEDPTVGARVVLDRMQVWQGSRLKPVKLDEVEAWIAAASALLRNKRDAEASRRSYCARKQWRLAGANRGNGSRPLDPLDAGRCGGGWPRRNVPRPAPRRSDRR
jgi:ANTAR domain